MTSKPPRATAFTLIEMLVVIAIIAILMGLAFPVFQSVQNSAKRTQAKNDLVQIVTAVNAFYTEYGKYPLPADTTGDEYTYGKANTAKPLFDTLRGLDATSNPRLVEFIKAPDAKDTANPKAGMAPATNGQFYDVWGNPYVVRIDADYDNQVPNPYAADTGAGGGDLRQGVIALSLGKDGDGASGAKNAGKNKDDVISWQ